MLTSAPRAATIVSLVAVLVACGGDGGPYPDDGAQSTSSASSEDTGGEGTASEGTTASSADTGAGDPGLARCVAWCMHRSACDAVEVTLADCELECGPTYDATPERCHGEVDAVFICAAGLDCAMASEFDIGELTGPCGDRIGAYRTCVAG